MQFLNRVAVVTGAAHGIGLAIADRFTRENVAVMLADIDGAGLARASEKLAGSSGAPVKSFVGDLSTRGGAHMLVSTCQSTLGRVDILVNNAGGGVLLPTLAHTEETLRATLARNLWTTIYCTLAVLPGMVERGYGRIVNLGAESVRNGLCLHAVYNAAKGGVHGFTTGLAREFVGNGITVNTVAPSIVLTEALAAITDPGLLAQMEKITSTIPAGRPATMDEVSSMVAYLASDESSFITGQVISVNGGSSML